MKILLFLQNQWFRNPEKVRQMIAARPDKYEWFIRAFLFMGCKTGQMLKAAFGDELCEQIIFCEASPQIGGEASSCFPADMDHIRQHIEKHEPDVVVALGKIAGDALSSIPELTRGFQLIVGPHPTARAPDTAAKLRSVAAKLKEVADARQK